MTTTTRTGRPSSRSTGGQSSRTIALAVGLLLTVIVAAVVAAVVVGSGTDETDAAAAASARIPTEGTVRQVWYAQASARLPLFDSRQPVDAAVGMTAPSIAASHFDDTEVSINFADGQPRVVLFLAHWCPHCQAEVSSLVSRFKAEGIRSDVELVAVSSSVDEGAPNYPPSVWLTREAWPVPVLRDSQSNDLATAFGLSGFPFAAAVNADGEIVARVSGAVPELQWNEFVDLALTS